MSVVTFVLLSCAGGLGAVGRLVLDGIVRSRWTGRLPWGTVLINLTGSFVLGVVTGAAAAGLVSGELLAVVGAGFLGGYTTFSTASFETVRLLQERRWIPAIANGFGVLLVASSAAALGLWLGAVSA